MKKVCDEKCFTCEFDDCIYGESENYKVLRDTYKGMGERLKRAIKANGLTQASLAKRTGISEPAISQYIHEKACPRTDYVVVLCRQLGITSDWLLGLNKYEGGGTYGIDN